MRENIAGVIRPVRMAANSSFATATAFSIFSSASRSSSSITPVPSTSSVFRRVVGSDDCPDLLTSDGPGDVAVGEQVEHHDGHRIVHAEADGGGVHDLQSAHQHLVVGELVELDRVRVAGRV